MPDLEEKFILETTPLMRIDKVLSERYPDLSRSYIQFLIEEGAVRVNDRAVKKRTIPKESDEIAIQFLTTPEISLEAEDIPLSILYEDDYLLAVDKPAGMVVHPAPGHPTGTFVHALLNYVKNLEQTDPVRPGIVHRLDKETSGVLIAAKTREVHHKLTALFAEREMKKEYIAICSNVPKEGVISAPITRHIRDRKRMCINFEKGKEAITEVAVLAKNERYSLVCARPKTGRTHQIRVHLKELHAPVVGDTIYGGRQNSQEAPRHLLHAHRLSFTHPITGEELFIEAPLPEDMRSFSAELSKSLDTI